MTRQRLSGWMIGCFVGYTRKPTANSGRWIICSTRKTHQSMKCCSSHPHHAKITRDSWKLPKKATATSSTESYPTSQLYQSYSLQRTIKGRTHLPRPLMSFGWRPMSSKSRMAARRSRKMRLGIRDHRGRWVICVVAEPAWGRSYQHNFMLGSISGGDGYSRQGYHPLNSNINS